jgi:DNA (cytosine-5)-methyltransferase 1
VKRPRKILVADLLCGAGGSSTGCARALRDLGLEMELVCVNHWPVAIDTHTRNHPEARHYVQDIATVRPHLIVPEGYLDLLMASPTCTHHSVARGGKPTSDQQRSDPWHIITWLTELRVKRIIIENVWEFCGWGPVDPRTGKPIKARKGEYFRAWIDTLRRLGFDPEWRKLNAADFGDATTRQRFILMARSDRRTVAWPVPTHRKRDACKLEFFPGVKPWRPARDIIDWEIKGKSIFGRKKPLAPKTLARIYAGAVKFKWPEPFLVVLRNHIAVAAGLMPKPAVPWIEELEVAGLVQPCTPEWEATKPPHPIIVKQNFRRDTQSVDDPAPTIMTEARIGLAQPIILANRNNNAAKGTAIDPTPCLTTAHGGGIAIAEPVIVNMKGQSTATSVDSPVPTQTSHAAHLYVAEAFVMATGAGAPRAAGEPLPTITTGGAGSEEREGCARPMLVEPFILNRHGEGYGDTRAHSVEDPAPTANCRGAGYLLEPFVLSREGGGAPRSVEDPTPTQVAKHSHCLISPYYGSGSGETCQSVVNPLPTVTAKARFGIVVPITHSADNSNRARDVETDPIPTLTTAHRGELAFITAQHGERPGQSPRVHDIEQPAPTICAEGHIDLVIPTEQYDILFRMLEPHELAAAMGFNSDEVTYVFAGTKTEKIKQIGNAVSVAKMKACVGAIMADAEMPAHQPPESSRAEEAAA